MNLYQFALNNSVNNIDPYGLDVWIEGASPNAPKDDQEPLPHQSISVGDPQGQYSSYSFGVNSEHPYSWKYLINGVVYVDPYGGGKIDKNHYLKTTPEEDAKVKAYLDSLVGTESTYCLLGANCRDFSKEAFKVIKEKILNSENSCK